ncbi:MAG: hypothetical protein ISS36_00785 [Candidatus Aenigmarchaeota archaeon]|nr:hypothetical protein [Candidatus Aenigmarchaeota archaeon]
MVRKAQFFILGAVILLALMLSSMSFYRPIASETENVEYMAENIANEHANALNLILKSGTPSELATFTNFLKEKTDFKAVWLVSEKQGSSLSITAGNFLGEDKEIIVEVGGNSETLSVPDSTAVSKTFSVSSAVKIKWDSEERTFDWVSDKTNMFVQINMERGENLVKKEINV